MPEIIWIKSKGVPMKGTPLKTLDDGSQVFKLNGDKLDWVDVAEAARKAIGLPDPPAVDPVFDAIMLARAMGCVNVRCDHAGSCEQRRLCMLKRKTK